jgi:cytochrome c oxidase subunit 3
MAVSGATLDRRIEVLSEAPAPPPRRPRVLLTGTLLAGIGAAAGIGALIMLYVRMRAQYLASPDEDIPWLNEAHISLTPGNVAFVTLTMSAVTAAAAGWSLRRGDRGHAMLSLATTLLFGAAFITGTAFAWEQLGVPLGEPATPEAASPALLIVVITAAHVAMVGAGMLYLLVMGFRALGGQLTGRAAEGFNAAVLYWYITIAVYAVVWYTIYVTK